MGQPDGKAANPARGQLNRENELNIPRSAFAPENLVSRDGFGTPVPRQPAHLHSQAKYGAYLLRDPSRVPRRRPFIYLNRHTPSGQSRVYRVTQLRTDGVHRRETYLHGDYVSVQYNGGLLPDTMLLTLRYHHWGTRLDPVPSD